MQSDKASATMAFENRGCHSQRTCSIAELLLKNSVWNSGATWAQLGGWKRKSGRAGLTVPKDLDQEGCIDLQISLHCISSENMSRRVGGNGDSRRKGRRWGRRRVVTVCRNVTFLNRFFPFISSWPRLSFLMAGDSDLSPLIAIDVFQLYLWHFKQYVCKHKGFLDLASCHLVWETSLIAIRCQSMGSRRKLCVLGPGMCFSFCLNMNIYSYIHLFPLEKKKWEPFPCGRKLGISRSRSSLDPGFVLWAEVPKRQAPSPCPTYQRNRDQYPSAPRLAFQVLSPRPCITDTIHVMSPVFTFLVD